MTRVLFGVFLLFCLQLTAYADTGNSYQASPDAPEVLAGGVRMIDVQSSFGSFKVWTKRVGNNPDIKVLILHGGPGGNHMAYEVFDSFFPDAGIEYYYYDQLGSWFSDKPTDPALLDLDRFVEEVEQVRLALGLGPENFYLYGHSWGGMLGMQYALKYQQHLKGLIVSNMVSSIPHYIEFAEKVMAPKLPPVVLAQIREFEAKEDYGNPRYQQLLLEHYYVNHIMRLPLDQWPQPVLQSFEHQNNDVYIPMQGPSEFGSSGILEDWDRSADLHKIKVPTLVIGAEHDTMDVNHMRWMSEQFPKGEFLYSPDGSHMTLYDDQQRYFDGLIDFITSVDKKTR